jgi:hypothetical protein
MLEDHLIYVHKIQAIYDVVESSVCKVVAESPNGMALQKLTSNNLVNICMCGEHAHSQFNRTH